MRHFDREITTRSRLLADLENQAAELERRLSDARVLLEREAGHFAGDWVPEAEHAGQVYHCGEYDAAACAEADAMPASMADHEPDSDHQDPGSGGQAPSPGERTEVLVTQGRRSTRYPRFSRRWKVAAGAAAATILVIVLVVLEFSRGASWPSSVMTVQREVTQACQNPDVKSEPGQINFACARSTRKILWVFSLLTSRNNPRFADPRTGRLGLEPIAPAQGSEVAWSLNLHHPYNPYNPVDSIEVAARAINNIIGGATLTGNDGKPVVQPGLEGHASNCARYTGSAAVTSRKGFPALCARPVTSPARQAALVADVYRKWVTGATPAAAHDAAVLFENSANPGDPQVRAVLDRVLGNKQRG